MSFTFQERPDSRAQSRAGPAFSLIYKAVGEQDDLIVANYAKSGTPPNFFTAYGTLYRQDIRIDPDGFRQYVVTVPYGPRKRDTGEVTFSFSTTGGTAHITAGFQHVADFAPADDEDGNDTNPFKGLINVTKDGVDGCDIVIPAMQLNYSIRHPEGVVDEALARLFARNVGKTNSDLWRGFQPGELLFMGATGSDGTTSEAEVGFQIIASENATGLTIGEIVDINKKGHDFLWIDYKKIEVNNRPAQKPIRVFTEKVYREVAFALILGFS